MHPTISGTISLVLKYKNGIVRISPYKPSVLMSQHKSTPSWLSNILSIFSRRKTENMAVFQYPGVNLPLGPEFVHPNEWVPIYPIGLPSCRAGQSHILPVREVAMMMLMDNLTDKPNWHAKVFDEAIVAKWRREAMTQSENGLFARIMEGKWSAENIPLPEGRIISEKAFEFVRQMTIHAPPRGKMIY